MNLRYITCSGIREFTSYEKIIALLNLSKKVEIGIPANSYIMGNKQPGNEWLFDLLDISSEMENPLNISIHMDNDWAQLFCEKGIIPFDIVEWFFANSKQTDKPVVKRWKFDSGNNPKKFNTEKIVKIINKNPELEFIFSYYDSLKPKFSRLNDMGAKFSLIYNPYQNKPNQRWLPPVFDNHDQGYMGGLCSENVSFNMDKIFALVPKDSNIWVEAFRNLQKQNSSYEFDFDKAKAFVYNTLKWLEDKRIK